MIPKIIHYCWFGENKKTKLIRNCIESWKLHLKDYEIIEWNETNCDLTTPFVLDAYKQEQWAFVSDYIRFEKLYEYGGIYLDTDMMVIKSFDSLLEDNCFFGAENENYISGGIFGAVKNDPFIKSCSDKYELIRLDKTTSLSEITIPKIITETFRTYYKKEVFFDKVLLKNNIKIYPLAYFYPFPYTDRLRVNYYKDYIINETVAIHLWNASWIEFSEFYYLRNKEYIKGIKQTIKVLKKGKSIEFKYFKKLASCIKESFLK